MLKQRIAADNTRVFMNTGHFADAHTWNGVSFTCVTDAEGSVKKSSALGADMSWAPNVGELTVYTPVAGFPGRAVPNESCFFDDKPYRIMRVDEDAGMYALTLISNDARAMGDY